MAFLQIRSQNPDFSFIIAKNPGTGMVIKSIRKGKAFAWYSDENTYNVYFKDADNEVSYTKEKDETFEYLNATRYNSTIFPLNAVSEFFSTASKKVNPQDGEGFANELTVGSAHVEHVRYLHFFERHFDDFKLTYEELAYKNYKIHVKTNKSIHHLLNYTNVLFLFLAILSEEYFDVSDSAIEKYVRSINVIDAPFYIRHLFVRNVLTGKMASKERFYKHKAAIEATEKYTINFAYGNTTIQRRDWTSAHFDFNRPIVDVGSGEGAYAIPYSSKIADHLYHAIDIDEKVRESLKRKLEAREIENVAVYESIDHFLESYDEERVDVLITEVVEHMQQEQARELLQTVLEKVNLNKLIVTTPNADFNPYYALEGFRHDDHKWEMSAAEFRQWIEETVDGSHWDYTFYPIGDSVDGVSTTQGVIITRKEGAM